MYSLTAMRHANFGGNDPYCGRAGVRRGSTIVPLDRALVSFYRLSVVTMTLNEAVCPQFAMQVFWGAVSPPLGGIGVVCVRIGITW